MNGWPRSLLRCLQPRAGIPQGRDTDTSLGLQAEGDIPFQGGIAIEIGRHRTV